MAEHATVGARSGCLWFPARTSARSYVGLYHAYVDQYGVVIGGNGRTVETLELRVAQCDVHFACMMRVWPLAINPR